MNGHVSPPHLNRKQKWNRTN